MIYIGRVSIDSEAVVVASQSKSLCCKHSIVWMEWVCIECGHRIVSIRQWNIVYNCKHTLCLRKNVPLYFQLMVFPDRFIYTLFFSPLKTGMNSLQKSHKISIYHVSSHYLVKLKTTHTDSRFMQCVLSNIYILTYFFIKIMSSNLPCLIPTFNSKK